MRIQHAALSGLIALLALPLAQAADTDGDGVVDNIDNCTLTANADQRDSNGDGFGNMCDGDFNNDDVVNAQDLGVMKSNFFSSAPDTDMNGDGVTNAVDLGLLKLSFFEPPGPTGDHPVIDECDCYFSSDCAAGQFCDWGSQGFTVEEDCWWRVPKPLGDVGFGCDTEYVGGPGPICDGYCTASRNGSAVGAETAEVLVSAVGLWADALIIPSARGGGPVDAQFANAALALPYARAASAMELGRHTADLLSMASDFGFYDYFCHYEAYPDDPDQFVDLTGDTCRVNAARLAVWALQAEIGGTGTAQEYIAQIADYCSVEQWSGLFEPRCKPSYDALECFAGEVVAMAEYLTTPRAVSPDSDEAFLDALRGRR